MKKIRSDFVAYSSLLLVGILLGSILFANSSVQAFWGNDQATVKTQQQKNTKQQAKKIVIPQEEAVKKVVSEVGPAVVSIVTEKVQVSRDMFLNPVPRKAKGLGSGIIFDKEGYILTNNHVVEGAEKIKVLLSDGREFEGQLVGNDPRNDLAVIKVKPDSLPVAPLGNSDKLEVGQLAIAIGSPYDVKFRNTVTTGVLSALDRKIRAGSSGHILEGLIQTDASINPGNSGGPLLNSQGEVIGINTAIIGDAQGIGFSIPINKAKKIVNDLIKYGRVKRPWLGIYGTKITKKLKNYYNLPVSNGVLILETIMDSPASQADLSRGDIIIEADHKKIKDMQDLKKIIKNKGINSRLKLLVMDSNGELNPVSITLKEMPTKTKSRK
ncbi:trypsin-like peptidase domain-containing protein [Halanaerocella petrolearia]